MNKKNEEKPKDLGTDWNAGQDYFFRVLNIRDAHIDALSTGDLEGALRYLYDELSYVNIDIGESNHKELDKRIGGLLWDFNKKKHTDSFLNNTMTMMLKYRAIFWKLTNKRAITRPNQKEDISDTSIALLNQR